MTAPVVAGLSIDQLRHKRDHAARACADLLVRGHLAEARRYAKESERFAEQIRAVFPAVSS